MKKLRQIFKVLTYGFVGATITNGLALAINFDADITTKQTLVLLLIISFLATLITYLIAEMFK